MLLPPKTVGIIGTGSLGQHLAQMLLTRVQLPHSREKQELSPIYVVASSRNDKHTLHLSKKFNNSLPILKSNVDIAKKSDAIIISVKPHQVKEVCREITPHLDGDTPIISVAAAVSLKKLRSYLPMSKTIIRCMPNITCSIGSGMVAYCSNNHADNIVKYIFEPNEIVKVMNDEDINLATVLIGSSPAFISWFGSQMEVIHGTLPQDVQRRMIINSIAGTAAMLLHQSASSIIKEVASPKEGQDLHQGITQGAINSLNSDCQQHIRDILVATYNKIGELEQ